MNQGHGWYFNFSLGFLDFINIHVFDSYFDLTLVWLIKVLFDQIVHSFVQSGDQKPLDHLMGPILCTDIVLDLNSSLGLHTQVNLRMHNQELEDKGISTLETLDLKHNQKIHLQHLSVMMRSARHEP